MKLIQFTVKRKYKWFWRVLFIVLACYPIWMIYDGFDMGYFQHRQYKRVLGEGIGFYLVLLKHVLVLGLLLWLAIGGVKEAQKEDSK